MDKGLNLYHSLGVTLDQDGAVTGSRWDGPAFNAGVVPGSKIVADDSIAYSGDELKQAITRAKGTARPIELLIRRGERYLSVPVSYSGGLRWPWLERSAPGGGPAPLDRLLAPKRPGAEK
jgi:predicted metalloprotease with PDZ domain